MKGKILAIVLVSVFLGSMCYFNIVPKATAGILWNFNTGQTEYHVDPNSSFNITGQVMMYQFFPVSLKLYAERMRLEGWTFKVIVPTISTAKTWYNIKIAVTVPEHPRLNYYGLNLFGNSTKDGRDWQGIYFVVINGNSTPIDYHQYYNYTDRFVAKEDYPRELYLPAYHEAFPTHVYFNPNATGISFVDVMYYYPDGGWMGTTGIGWSYLITYGSHGNPCVWEQSHGWQVDGGIHYLVLNAYNESHILIDRLIVNCTCRCVGMTPPDEVVAMLNLPDLNGNGQVDICDIVIVTSHYGAVNGTENYDIIADVTKNNIIDIFDVVAVTGKYGKRF